MWGLTMVLWKDVIVPLASAAIGALITLAVALTGYVNKGKELDIQMLQLALSILREDPNKSQLSAVRGWAIDIINEAAPVAITPEARQQLLDTQLHLSIEQRVIRAKERGVDPTN